MRFWPHDEPKFMYAIRLLKHMHVVVWLSKSEGLQKWLAPCAELLVQLMSVSLRRNLTGTLR
jgi:hypothetical protein